MFLIREFSLPSKRIFSELHPQASSAPLQTPAGTLSTPNAAGSGSDVLRAGRGVPRNTPGAPSGKSGHIP